MRMGARSSSSFVVYSSPMSILTRSLLSPMSILTRSLSLSVSHQRTVCFGPALPHHLLVHWTIVGRVFFATIQDTNARLM